MAYSSLSRFAFGLAAFGIYLVVACSSESEGASDQTAGGPQAGNGQDDGGRAGQGASGGAAGEGAGCGGSSAGSEGGGASGGPAAGGASGGGTTSGDGGTTSGDGGTAGGSGASAGCAGNAGSPPRKLEELLTEGELTSAVTARPTFGAVLIANHGERVYAVEARRDAEPGPLGLPWRSRFRLAAYDGGVEAWVFEADPDDVISDVAVHPSGDVTLSILRHPPDRMAFDLVRLDSSGTTIGALTLSEPATIPAGDYGSGPQPLFRMKSDFADANVGGWLRLSSDGEGVFAVFLSYVDVAESDPLRLRIALGVTALRFESGSYRERWARVVEGPHAAQPAAWAYDELRWREQAIRPFLARDESTGDVLVGSAWNSTRCQANVALFAEFTADDCLFRAVSPLENERLPLSVTRFDANGARLGTTVLMPDEDAAEQIPFALSARGGQLAVAGSVVRKMPDGSPRTYPDPDGFVDYDGYLATYDASGQRQLVHDFNLGRGDVLSALRWTSDGIIAAGSAGWDRWQGGMSISRGADPLLAWLSQDASRSATRVLPLSDGARHFTLHDLVLSDAGALIAHGFSDAPMTHSADGGNHAARTFGTLQVRLSRP